MKVKAIMRGHFKTLREPGEVFSIPDKPAHKDGTPKMFSKRWMKRVKDHVEHSRPELDEDGKLIEPPRKPGAEPVANIKDVAIDGAGEKYVDDGSDDYPDEGVPDEPEPEPAAPQKRGRSPARGKSAKPTVHE